MRRTRALMVGALTVVTALAMSSGGSANAGTPRGTTKISNTTDRGVTGPGVDVTMALVQLVADPLATSVRTRPPTGKKIDFNSAAVKSERARLSALRNDFKAWLRANAPKANVTGEFDTSLNAVAIKLNAESLSTIAGSPLVRHAEYQGVYQPLVDDPDLAIISAVQAWNRAGGAANAGAGVKVAVIDTGIDTTHICFSDTGYPQATQLGDQRFTNNKVIAAKVFNNKAASRGYTAEAIQDHGTHVAGTVACNHVTPATVSGVAIPYAMSGVAPRALLGNYNVFPGDVASARSEDILNALDAAYADGFDVTNMSLGGGAHGIQDLLTIAVDNLDQANMVVAVAAGNSGPGHETIQSPGSAARALTAGASTVPHFVGAPVTVAGSTYGAAIGDFATVSADLTASLGVVAGPVNGLSTACTDLPAGSLSGKIALISRGVCTFSQKIRVAQDAGAVAVLVVNNVGGDPIAMGLGGIPNEPTVPAYQLGLTDGLAVKANDGVATTIGATLTYFATTNVDIMAGFSSQGPTDVDFRVKPDVVAPGVNVLSSVPHTSCATPPCFAFFQGTSMATPHLAGSAAVVIGQHPTWTAAQVRSAIVNTADQGVLKNFAATGLETDVNVIGAGRENLFAATGAVAALDPVSTTFGSVPAGSGQTRTASVTVTNLASATQTFGLLIDTATGSGVTFSVNPSSVTLAAGVSVTLTITMTAATDAGAGDHFATLGINSGGVEVSHAVVYALVK